MAVPQLQLANLGEIFAQNQARQAEMDTMQLQQDEALAARDARIEKANREKLLREKLATGEVNLQSPEGFSQLLKMGVITPDQYLSANETLTAIAKNKAQGEAATLKAQTAQQKLELDRQNIQSQIQNRNAQLRISAAQLGISQKSANATYMKARAAYDKDRAELLGQSAYNLKQLSPEQQGPAYQIWRQQQIANGTFEESDLPQEYDDKVVTAFALGFANKSKGTGKPVAVIDPNTGQAVYVAPEQAIGKQPASKDDEGSFKEYQYKAAQYGQRMNSASENMKSFENPSVLEKAFQKSGMFGNFAQTPERQMYYQAQREFINAIKRQESGAAVTDSEVEDYAQTYFPQPGDTPEVMQRKRQARERAIAGNKATAGGAWEEVSKAVSAVAESQPTPSGGGQGGEIDDLLNRYAPQ